MSSKLDQLFTHIEVLKSREHTKKNAENLLTSDMMDSNKEGTPFSKIPTLSGLLEISVQRVYKSQPIYDTLPSSNPTVHKILCKVGKWKGIGSHSTKKNAKHLAAKDVLLQIIKDGRHEPFGIPGITAEEAEKYINNLMPDLKNVIDDKEAVSTSKENWVGRCEAFCSKKSVTPNYIFAEEGKDNLKIFHCTVTVLELVATRSGKTKKTAKNAAADELFKMLLEHKEFKKEYSYDEMVKTTKEDYPIALFKKKNVLKADIEENFISNKSNSENFEDSGFPKIAFSPVKTHQQTSEGRRRSIYATIKEALKAGPKNSEKKLLEILGENDHIINKTLKMKTLKFSKAEPISGFENLDYIQVYLEMQNCLTRKKILKIRTFCGEGTTENEARDDAAWNAIHFLNSCAFKKEEKMEFDSEYSEAIH